MAKKIVTLYVDDTCLRLMVTDGKRIKGWADLPLEPDLVRSNLVIKEAEVAAKIKQLFKAQKITTKDIIVGMSGLHCLTRPITLPELPNVMLDEAVKREAKRVLPVHPEQLYISWQTTPAPQGKTQVFLVGIPCTTADALLKALHQAGLKPSFMDLKPLLLARVVKEATAIIVDIQTTEFDIVVMSDGVPQPIRTIPFANEALSWEEKLTTIKNELNRTITFYNSNNPEKALTSSIPIFVSGDLANEPELCQSLSDELGYPVLLLPSPLECPERFDPSRYMVNIGLALQKLAPGKEAKPSVVSLNSLPAPYQPKPISLINIFALPGAALAAGLLILLVILTQSASTDIDSIRGQLNTTDQFFQHKLSQRQELAGNIAELQKEITRVEASRDSFTATLGSLEEQSAGINRDLEVTMQSLPNTISLSSISHANGILTISGRAPSEGEVLLYLKKLDTSGSFSEITIANMSRIEGKGMDFTLFGSLQTQSNEAGSIQVALKSLPSTVTLTSVSCANGTLTIDGRSPDEDAVLSYLQDLEASGKFSEIVPSMTRNENGGMDFSLALKTEVLKTGE
ncbi:PilN domain-containing protein [Chloroflexota bacterium]